MVSWNDFWFNIFCSIIASLLITVIGPFIVDYLRKLPKQKDPNIERGLRKRGAIFLVGFLLFLIVITISTYQTKEKPTPTISETSNVTLNETPTSTPTPTPTQKPIASFTMTPGTGNAPLTVVFKDQSFDNPTSWVWDFGDGGTSTVQNPTHTYYSAGKYTIILTLTNSVGSSTTTFPNDITVTSELQKPTALFGTSTPGIGNAPLSVTFTDSSSGNPTSWLWKFGDGGASTDQNPTHLYKEAGNYTVSLTVTNSFGTNTLTFPNCITVTSAS